MWQDGSLCWIEAVSREVSVVEYMDGVVREVNAWVFGRGLELLPVMVEGLNPLLFVDDTALVAKSEKKLCRLVSEFGRVKQVLS